MDIEKVLPDINYGADVHWNGYFRPLRLVEVRDPRVSRVVALATATQQPSWRIHEWWILPPHNSHWDTYSLKHRLLNSTNELVEMCLGLHSEFLCLGDSLKARICEHLFPPCLPEDLKWHIMSAMIPQHGQVVQVICGTRAAMADAYRRHEDVMLAQVDWNE